MASIIHSAAPYGFHTSRVEVEVDVAQGMPQFTIGGLGDTAIHESKERIRSAIKNSGYKFPDGRVTVNLAPASSRKEGASLDCAIALGILTEMGVISPVSSDIVVLGELALNGSVRPIQGAIRIALDLVKHHPGTFIIPESNFLEVRVVEGLTYIPVRTLGDILSALQPDSKLERVMGSRAFLASAPSQSTISVRLEDIAGHEQAKRALMIAAAGNHHLLLYGPPGAGKSILAQA
ncbi:MAG: ATP-binding protein, partial [Candidatus Kerfeldbacteria bacterium]|nr:ATP-binding protein [Candidatus Kerfeldbacteria bacterium]